jgi:hypothetical protein
VQSDQINTTGTHEDGFGQNGGEGKNALYSKPLPGILPPRACIIRHHGISAAHAADCSAALNIY